MESSSDTIGLLQQGKYKGGVIMGTPYFIHNGSDFI
jgi:hypothetical protein